MLDPLDGTNNYVLGIPCFTVSIGILRAGFPHVGVIHDPNTGFTAWAVSGAGAFAGDRELNLSGGSLTAASNVCVRVPVAPDLEPLAIDWMRRFKFRGFGSVALQLAYVATGGVDLFLDHRAALRDLAAGAALVIEAGGRVTDPEGTPIFPSSWSTIAVAPSRSSRAIRRPSPCVARSADARRAQSRMTPHAPGEEDTMYKRILIPTDGSELSEMAIRQGVTLAKSLGAEVIGITVFPTFFAFAVEPLMITSTPEQHEKECAAAGQKYLAVVTEAARAAGVRCDVIYVLHDQPYAAIIEAATARGCDLICMASHGRKGVAALVLGSETTKVLTHSKIPVLVCR